MHHLPDTKPVSMLWLNCLSLCYQMLQDFDDHDDSVSILLTHHHCLLWSGIYFCVLWLSHHLAIPTYQSTHIVMDLISFCLGPPSFCFHLCYCWPKNLFSLSAIAFC